MLNRFHVPALVLVVLVLLPVGPAGASPAVGEAAEAYCIRALARDVICI